MLLKLILHRWTSFVRSPAFSQHLAQSLFLGLFFLYLAFNFLALGFIGGKILREVYPNQNIYNILGGFLMYYFIYDLVLRSLIQKFPILDVKKYLPFNIKKSTLTNFLLITSISSFFNFLPLFGLIPFVLSNYSELQTLGILSSFCIVVIGFIIANNYLGFLLDRLFKKESIVPYVIIGLISTGIYIDYEGYLDLSSYFQSMFQFLINSHLNAIIPLSVAALAYFTGYKLIHKNLYIEDLIPVKVTEAKQINLGFLEIFGVSGKLMLLEIKLILRNKRSKSMLFLSFIMLLYPFIFMGSDAIEMTFIRLFIGIFVTGMFALNYGQLMLSWNSAHFDLLATRKIKIEDIFRAKYYILVFSCVILFLLSLLYGFLYPAYFWTFSMMFLYNIGISIFIYMFLAGYNSKRIDLSKGAMMNYEGISAAHFLIMIPIIVIPILIRWPFAHFGYGAMGETMIGFIGMLGFIFHNKLIDLATKNFMGNRYKIMAAFRKKI